MQILKSQPEIVNIYINGIRTNSKEYINQAQNLSKRLNSSLYFTHNQSDGIQKDILNSLAGLLSDKLGYKLESEVASKLESLLLKNVGKKINIFVHSQGSIVLKNTLERLMNSNYPLKNLQVTTLGAANFLWPENLKVKNVILKKDYLSLSLAKLNQTLFKFFNQVKNTLGFDQKLEMKPLELHEHKSQELFEHKMKEYNKLIRRL